MYVTEDTTRAHPDTLRLLFSTAVRAGASRLVHCGHGRPRDAERRAGRSSRMSRRFFMNCGADHVGIDWHGHRDRGFGVASSIAALEAGATRLHGAALGIGERCGNTPIDLLLVNLVMMGYIDRDLTALPAYCRGGGARLRRADCEQLSSHRRRRVQNGDRRARGGGRQGVSHGRSRADGCGVLGGAGQPRRPRAADRDWPALGTVERRLLAGECAGCRSTDEVVDRIFAAAKASRRTLTHDQVQKLAGEPATSRQSRDKSLIVSQILENAADCIQTM